MPQSQTCKSLPASQHCHESSTSEIINVDFHTFIFWPVYSIKLTCSVGFLLKYLGGKICFSLPNSYPSDVPKSDSAEVNKLLSLQELPRKKNHHLEREFCIYFRNFICFSSKI